VLKRDGNAELDALALTLFQQGSARIALETNPPFDHYLFIERNPTYIAELEPLSLHF
jgi:hypothetical protein